MKCNIELVIKQTNTHDGTIQELCLVCDKDKVHVENTRAIRRIPKHTSTLKIPDTASEVVITWDIDITIIRTNC